MPAEVIDIDAGVDQAVSRWEKAAARRDIELTHGRNGSAPSCVCARSDFDRVLDSVIENAMRYSPPDSQVSVVTTGDRIEVLDRGPGLEPGEEEAVFERFHRGRAGRHGRPGTGLGLLDRPGARRVMGRPGHDRQPGGRRRASGDRAPAPPAGRRRRG